MGEIRDHEGVGGMRCIGEDTKGVAHTGTWKREAREALKFVGQGGTTYVTKERAQVKVV